MSPQLAANLGLSFDPSSSIPVEGIGGKTHSLGRVSPLLTIGSLSLTTEFHIINSLVATALLGNIDASRFKLDLDFTDNTVTQRMDPPPILAINSSITKEALINSLELRPIFAKSVAGVGRITIEKHVIRTKDDLTPIAQSPYRYSDFKRKIIDGLVEEVLNCGFVRRSNSPWSAPVTIASKKDGTWRLCIDYRKLNAVTSSYRHPIPLVQDLLDRVGQSSIFTTLDAVCGYWHVAMDEESIEKTAFVTHSGHFEWLVMPFGLKNAPATFQRIMQRILQDFVGRGVEVYLDDIVIHSKTTEEHAALVSKVLDTLEASGIRLKKSKCSFFSSSIEYLGHIISAGEIRPTPTKIQSVRNYPTPTKLKDIQSFLGLANYYRDFIPDMSITTKPLSKLTKKDVPFEWGEDQQRSFEQVKNILTSEPVLAVFDPNLDNGITTDASKLGLAAIFTQLHPDGRSRVVCYWSRATSDTETRYSACELECLAVVESLEHFRVYIEGTNVKVTTDCSALRWMNSFKDTSSRLFRWTMRLSTFTYEVKHRSGKSNTVADALSRNPPLIAATAIGTIPLAAFRSRQHELSSYDVRLPSRIIEGIKQVSLRNRRRILVPPSLIADVLATCHDERMHVGTNLTHQLVSHRYWWPSIAKDVTDYVKSCHTCQVVKPPNHRTTGTYQPVEVPEMPLDIWSLDTVVLGSAVGKFEPKYAQCFVDHHSRHTWTFPTRKNSTEVIIASMSSLIGCVGPPRVIITDNGTNLTSEKFEKFLARYGIEHRVTSIAHPQANGLNERTHYSIIRGISLRLIDTQKKYKWSRLAKEATRLFNTTPHSVTGFPPCYLQFEQRTTDGSCDVPVAEARRLAVERTIAQQER